jgi:hypothetical protein
MQMTKRTTFSLNLAKCEVMQFFVLNDTEKVITSPRAKFSRVFQRKTTTPENFQVVMSLRK